jgi:hypothetical protein
MRSKIYKAPLAFILSKLAVAFNREAQRRLNMRAWDSLPGGVANLCGCSSKARRSPSDSGRNVTLAVPCEAGRRTCAAFHRRQDDAGAAVPPPRTSPGRKFSDPCFSDRRERISTCANDEHLSRSKPGRPNDATAFFLVALTRLGFHQAARTRVQCDIRVI